MITERSLRHALQAMVCIYNATPVIKMTYCIDTFSPCSIWKN
jgi:hypothetical protein